MSQKPQMTCITSVSTYMGHEKALPSKGFSQLVSNRVGLTRFLLSRAVSETPTRDNSATRRGWI